MTARRRRIIAGSLAAIIGLAIASLLLRDAPDTLRIHVEAIGGDDGRLARRWTFSSGRRWESYGKFVRGGEHVVVLDPPGARDGGAVRLLKSLMGRGADRVTYEVEVDGRGGGDITVTRTMKGNAGGTPAFSSTSTSHPLAIGSTARGFVIQEGDTVIGLPARVRLGVFGGTSEVIEFR